MDKGQSIKIISENIVYQNQYGKLYDDIVEFSPQKVSGTYVRWKFTAPYSVAIVPILPSNEYVLVENFRHAARKSITELPKGYGTSEQAPLEVAKKELQEEIGLLSNRWEYIGEIYADTSFTYHPIHLYIAWDCYSGEIDREVSEVILDIHRFKLDLLSNQLKEGRLIDAVTLYALYYLNNRRE